MVQARVVLALAGAAAVSVPLLLASPFGINAHIPWSEVLDEAVGVGVDWVRIDFRWPLVEPEQDGFDWSIYDELVTATEARGLRIYASIGETPAWATSGEAGVGRPDDPGDWHDVCYRAAARYRGRIAAWGLWNEPNLPHFWAGTRQQYITEILLVGARAIRSADPQALVCGPDLAHLSSHDWDDWLEAVLAQAAAELDVVTHHVYPNGADHSTVTEDLDRGGSYPWDPPAVREILEDAGWFGRPFWLTETGVNADTHGERDQAMFYTRLLLDWFRPERDLWWVDRVFFYQLFDDPRYPELAWGIFGPPPELSPRQAVTAYRAFIASSEVDDAEIDAIVHPGFALPETAIEVAITLVNSGTTTWTAEAGYLLGDQLGDQVWPLPEGAAVAPGQSVTVKASVTMGAQLQPAAPALLRWRMLREGLWWFGELGTSRVTVSSAVPPVLVLGPSPAGAFAGESVLFRVQARGPGPLTFGWYRNGLPIGDDSRFVGADSPELVVLEVDRHVTGEYRCVVGNDAGSVASAPAALVLFAPRRDRPTWERDLSAGEVLPAGYSPWRYGTPQD